MRYTGLLIVGQATTDGPSSRVAAFRYAEGYTGFRSRRGGEPVTTQALPLQAQSKEDL